MVRGLCVALILVWSATAHATVYLNPTPLDVGDVLVGTEGSADGTLGSSEYVRADLTIGGCIGGGGTFTVSPSSNVNLLTPQLITVSFLATANGVRNCTLTVTDSNTATVVGTFVVRGTGTSPPAAVLSGNGSFGMVRFNNAAPVNSVTRSVTITNSGGMQLSVTAVTITGANAGDFSFVGGTTATINAGTSKLWTVTFNPSAAGARSATLSFTTNAPGPQPMMPLDGTGTNAVIAITDSNYGVVAVGSSKSLDVTVSNTGAVPKGPLGVTSAVITGGAGWFSFSSCGTATTTCPFSPAISVTTSTVVGIRCTPPSGTATQNATVTFTSDSDAGGDTIASLSCTAGSSSLATNMATVTFPPLLVGTTGPAQTLTVTNGGTLSSTFYFRTTGANAGSYQATQSSGCGTSSGNQCAIAPAASVTFTVTHVANVEGPTSAGLDLVSSSSPFPQLTLAGRGIDRHINVPDSVLFADTFQSAETLQPVTIENTGEYPLTVSEVAISGEPVWSLAEPFAPLMVAPLSSLDVLVRFAPGTIGKAPSGLLAVTSDDRIAPTKTIVLDGNGNDRNIQVNPRLIDLGDRSVGMTTRLSEIRPGERITIVNMDESPFELREIAVDGDAAFEARDLNNAEIAAFTLAPGDVGEIDVLFTPMRDGELTAELGVYFDQDPRPQTTISVRARAITVDVHGGGGCATSHGAGPLALLLALGLRRRSRVTALRSRS